MIFYLIDGNGFCYRAFHAIRDLRNSKGEPTNVVYGFSLMLKKILEDFRPDGIGVAFDAKGPTFRHEKFDAYKAHRKPMPEDLVHQMPVVKRLVESWRIPRFEKGGFEADDLMATMATALSLKNHRVVIVTGDKDMFQLVTDRIQVMNPQKDYRLYREADVESAFGVKPSQVVDVLALMGDPSDAIPGVPGIGEKTALELIRTFGSLDALYQHLDRIPQEARKKALRESRESAYLSRDLARVDSEVPMEFNVEDLILKGPDLASVRSLYRELEFRTLLKDLPAEAPAAEGPSKDYRLITDQKAWQRLLSELEQAKEFAFDFETTGTNPLLAEPVGISFCLKPHTAAFVLFSRHVFGESPLEAKDILGSCRHVFENPGIGKIGQNLKYEMAILRQFGIRLKGIVFDTMIGSYLLNASKRNHNLDDLAEEYLGESLIPIERLIGKGRQAITMAEADVQLLVRYGCQDSDVALRLAEVLRKGIVTQGLSDLCQEMEIPLIEVLCDMECAGISIDRKLLVSLSKGFGRSLDQLTRKIYQVSECDFNIDSPKQLSEVLFQKLRLPAVRKTKTGLSTDVEVLTELADLHELPQLVLEYRELSKLKSTYADTMPEMVNPRTGRIHSSFNQTVTETGRLSSNEPNLQNIPVRKEEGRRIRQAFVAEPGYVFLSADYSQIELRVLAHLSKDPVLGEAFRRGRDIHATTARLIFGVEHKDVTPEMRETAKTVNFGVLYGMSAFGLSRALRISQDSARDFIRSYFERYPRVKAFIDETLETARRQGYVETLFKRRRLIPEIRSSDRRLRQVAERMAINAPVQGSASDIIKLAMIAIHKRMVPIAERCRMVLQVHDELVFEMDENRVGEWALWVKEEMEKAVTLDVPLEVILKQGPNWRDLERWDPEKPGGESRGTRTDRPRAGRKSERKRPFQVERG